MKLSYFSLSICLSLLTTYDHIQAQTYSMPGGTITTCAGNFYDTGGNSGAYNNNEDLTTVFSPSTAGSNLSFSFTSLNLHDGYDFLYIHDGNSTSAPLMGIYTGTASPGTITASNLNPTGSITFRFVSNGWTANPGWAASISCVGTPGNPRIAAQNGTFSSCNATFTDQGGNAVYTSSSDLVTTLSPSTAGQFVKVSFSSFSLETDYDWLYVYDGNSTSAPLIGLFTGSSLPGTAFTPGVITASSNNPGGCLTFRFITDVFNNYNGWQATVTCSATPATPSYSIAPGTVSTCAASFTDIGGVNNNYRGSADITNTYCPSTPGKGVSATFTSLALESHYDHLYIYDGTTSTSPLIGIYTSTNNPGTITASTYNASGCLTFRFVSDTWITDAGWVANMSCTNKEIPYFAPFNQTVYVDSARFTDDGGATGNYYYNRSSSVVTTETICPSTPGCVKATFRNFNTEGSIDYLKIYDGNSTSAPLLGTWFGTAFPGTLTASGSNTTGCLTFEFTNSGWNSTSGWQADITTSCRSFLPVELISFSGQLIDDETNLKWSTASELNNDHFEIERSVDGKMFKPIGKVAGGGTRNGLTNYAFIDKETPGGTSYYKLRQVDFDGKFEYSGIVAVERKKAEQLSVGSVFPNPTQNVLRFKAESERDQELTIEVINELGELKQHQTYLLETGIKEYEISLDNLPTGIYFIKFREENGTIILQKIVRI